METSFLNNNIKVPEPNVANAGTSVDSKSNVQAEESNNKTKSVKKAPSRVYDRPKVGVLSVPSISKTPISDSFVRKQQEFPYTKYKVNFKKPYTKDLKPHALASLGIVLMGLIALFKKK